MAIRLRARRTMRCMLLAFGAIALGAGLPGRSVGAVQEATWLGGVGMFNDATRWSGGVVPNNNATTSFNVLIDGGNVQSSIVTLAASVGTITLDHFLIDAGDRLQMTSAARLNALQGATVNGALSVAGGFLMTGPDATLDGSGEIFCPAGQSLSIGSSTGNFATDALAIGPALSVHAFNGVIGNALGPLTNAGTITADGVAQPNYLSITSTKFTNSGTLVIQPGGTLAIAVGSYSIADLGTVVNNGGRLRLGGNLYNAGNTLESSGTLGAIRIDGTMHGGTLSVATGQTQVFDNFFGSTLDSVWINGAIQLNHPLRIAGDHVLRGTNLVVTLNDRNDGFVAPDTGTLTIAPGVTIKGTGTVGGAFSLLNRGLLLADGGYIGVDGHNFVNQGVLEVRNGGTLRVGERSLETTKTADLGVVKYGPGGGTFQIGGILDNTDNVFTNGAPINWQIYGKLRGGVLRTAPNAPLACGEYENVTLDHATIYGGTVVSGSLNGTGTVLMGGGYFYSRNTPVTITPNITLIGQGLVGLYGVINTGTVIASGGGELRIQTGHWNSTNSDGVNLGTYQVNSGSTFEMYGNYTRAQMGKLINNGGTFAIANTGTLNNAGQIFDSYGLGPWVLQGTMRGGTLITSDPSRPLYIDNYPNQPAVLDDVTVNGVIYIVPLTQLQVPTGQTLHGDGQVIIKYGSGYGSVLSTPSGTFTIGQGMTVSRIFYDIYDPPLIGTNGAPFVNHGTLRSESPQAGLDVIGTGAFNDGIISIGQFASLQFRGGLTMDDGGTFVEAIGSQGSGVLKVLGDLNLESFDDYLVIQSAAAPMGSTYLIATYSGQLFGTFDHVVGDVTVDYAVPGSISVTVVPEPLNAMLFAGTASLCAVLRRRH